VGDLPRSEEATLRFWQEHKVFEASLAKPAPRGSFVFFEGPPTANNVPHVGHALTRTIKDLFPRFRTMLGYRVERKAGWDTHGLPVEIAIEKELGFTDKNSIEDYGVEPFNQKCYESVRRYERAWVEASERLGFWLDYDGAYFTFSNRYVESVWWILHQMFQKDMLYEGHKVLPYCPLCGTTHSSHEVAQAYQDVKDPSVTVAFQLLPGQKVGGTALPDATYILAWTTTPWTLPSNMATCVHPEHRYKVVESQAHPGRHYLIADGLEGAVEELIDNKPIDLREQPSVAQFSGADLEGLQYQPLFDFSGSDTEAAAERGRNWSVTVDPYVTLDSGTGIVHVAPAFGEDDHRIGLCYGLAMYSALGTGGRFKAHAGEFANMWFKDADPEIIGDLKSRGLLVRSLRYEHPYPHCWRHGTPLYYCATSSWFVRTTAMREQLIAGNQQIQWTPSHIRDGRFGKWLEGVVDWALSRKRYWGTPLPLWRCGSCNHIECFGSYAALFERAGRQVPADLYDREQWNPHRPYVDEIGFDCSECEGTMARVVEVIDCWFDAGSMPFAQHHYPFTEGSRELIDSGAAFPADFISEAVDQTRGWFYTLHVISTFLRGRPAFDSCVVLGHVLDESGRKMSKSVGNVIAPDEIIDVFGADAFRWFFYRSNPTLPSRFGPGLVRDSLKAFMIPLLNAWSFFAIYASLDGFRPNRGDTPPAFSARAPLDQWILSRLQHTITAVTDDLSDYRIVPATEALESFVEELTNWYIRRSRRRFWKSEADSDKAAAHWTLYEVLTTIARLIAPFTPYLAERMHQDLVRPFVADAPISVHLAHWPEADPALVKPAIVDRMAAARQAVTLGHAARQSAAIGVRQPLAAATIVTVSAALQRALQDSETSALVCSELNVRSLEFAADRGAYVTYQLKPNFRTLGKRLGKKMPMLARAVAGLDAAATVSLWEGDGRLEIALDDGEIVLLSGDDLDIRIQQREGTASAYDDTALVAIDTALTDDLLQEGVAREVINRIQAMRKELDLAYDDRISLSWDGGPAVVEALGLHRQLVADEVLAVQFQRLEGLQGGKVDSVRGEPLAIQVEVAPR
jgi:isoleucyl-tRNA synthetase